MLLKRFLTAATATAMFILLIALLCSCSKQLPGGNSDSKSLTERDASVLHIAISVENEPFEYTGDSGEILGFDAALGMCLAEKMGMEAVFYNMKEDFLLSSLSSGIANIALFALEATDYQRRVADFSDSYITLSSSIVTSASNSSVNDTKSLEAASNIGVIYNSSAYKYLKFTLGLSNITEYYNQNAAAEAMLLGDIDVMVTDSAYAEDFAAAHPDFAIRETGINRQSFLIAVAKGNSDLLKKINKILDEFKEDNTLLNLRRAYVNGDAELRADFDARLKELQNKS